MVVDDVRVRLREKLEAAFGAEEASVLMDRPPGGWNDLVTNQMLDAKLETFENKMLAMEHRLIATMERGFRVQTWRLMMTMLAAITASVTLSNVT